MRRPPNDALQSIRAPTDAADAVRRAAVPDAKYLGGGTNLVDLMRETIERPAALIDVTEPVARHRRAGRTVG